jgi:uncharacterized protein YjbJ (UPF0337 family)
MFVPLSKRGFTMATTDKAKNTAQQAKGKVKEAAGKVTRNDSLRKTGKADQRKGDLKQAGEKVKDALAFKK